MQSKLIILLMLVSVTSFASTVCSSYLGECHYYDCVQNEKHCSKNGYLLNYGKKYCQVFTEVQDRSRVSDSLSQWIGQTRLCLMEEMDKFWEGETCFGNSIRAFESHAGCYISAGFCELSLQDQFSIMYIVRDGMKNPAAYIGVFDLIKGCLDSRNALN